MARAKKSNSGYTSVTSNWTKSDKAGASVPSVSKSSISGSDLKAKEMCNTPKDMPSYSMGASHAGPGTGDPSKGKKKYGKG